MNGGMMEGRKTGKDCQQKRKLLSVIIPCYNSQDYMERAIRSALPGNKDIEILIVDDGSRDATGEIADRYAEQYPHSCIAIHKENGGHGDAILSGLSRATGIYVDVLDSDDWLDQDAFLKMLSRLSKLESEELPPDAVIRNMVYDQIHTGHRHTLEYRKYLPQDRVLSWMECQELPPGIVFFMHSIVFRTELLKSMQLDLPKHTFYVDHLYAYFPMQKVQRLCYLDADVYHYCIGRPGQSVQEEVMLRQVDQAVKVCRIMLEKVDLGKVEEQNRRYYMRNYLEMAIASTYAFLTRNGSAQSLDARDELIAYMEQTNPWFRENIRHRLSGAVLALPGQLRKWAVRILYRYWYSIYRFN